MKTYLKVPESHCEAATKHVPSPAVHMAKTRGWNADEMYEYLMKHSVVFQNLGFDQRGQLLMDMKKALDKKGEF